MSEPPRIGVDLGGTRIKAGVVGERSVLRDVSADTPRDFAECVESVAALVERLLDADVSGQAEIRPEGIGLAVPGVIDFARGVVIDSPNLPYLNGQPLAAALAARLGLPVLLENDATAAALGEGIAGAGRTHRDFLLVTIGTGVGGGLVLDGRAWRGPHGMAGEFGHLKVGHEHRCSCGGTGCVEAAVSATALLARGREAGVDAGSLLELADAARRGDRAARVVFRHAGALLGEGLAQVALLLDLRVFLIGGGGAPVLDLLRETALQVLGVRCFGRAASDFRLAAAELGNSAGIVGASRLRP